MKVTDNPKPISPRPLTLSRALFRGHLFCSLIAACIVGMCLTIAGGMQLRSLVNHNLHLVARSLAYTVEAAVVFRDRNATRVSVETIAANDGIESVSVTDAIGEELAHWERPSRATFDPVRGFITNVLLKDPVSEPVVSQNIEVGEVRVYGSADGFINFIAQSLAAIFGCVVISVLVTLYLSRRVFRGITVSLRELTRVTHEVRTARAFGQRVPPARITDLNALATDFNSLLAELESWEAGIQQDNQSLVRLATHDDLTGLANRALFQ